MESKKIQLSKEELDLLNENTNIQESAFINDKSIHNKHIEAYLKEHSIEIEDKDVNMINRKLLLNDRRKIKIGGFMYFPMIHVLFVLIDFWYLCYQAIGSNSYQSKNFLLIGFLYAIIAAISFYFIHMRKRISKYILIALYFAVFILPGMLTTIGITNVIFTLLWSFYTLASRRCHLLLVEK